MTTITSRRAILAGAAATPALSLPAVAAPSRPVLSDLIEAHRRAFECLREAMDQVDAAHDDVMIPLNVLPNGDRASSYCEFPKVSAEEIRHRIEETHEQLRRIHCSRWARAAFPDFPDAMEAALKASQEQALRALDAAVRSYEQNPIRRLYLAADAAEIDARLNLTVYRPTTPAEAKLKADYINTSTPFRDEWCNDVDFVSAIIDRLGQPMEARS